MCAINIMYVTQILCSYSCLFTGSCMVYPCYSAEFTIWTIHKQIIVILRLLRLNNVMPWQIESIWSTNKTREEISLKYKKKYSVNTDKSFEDVFPIFFVQRCPHFSSVCGSRVELNFVYIHHCSINYPYLIAILKFRQDTILFFY